MRDEPEKEKPIPRKKPCPCHYCTKRRLKCHDPKKCKNWAEWKPEQELRAAEILKEKQKESYYRRIGKSKTKTKPRASKQLHAAKKQEETPNG